MKRILRKRFLLPICLVSVFVGLGIAQVNAKQPKGDFTYLHTSGNKIVDAAGKIVGLSGLNWFGLETANYAPHGLWTRNWESMLDQVRDLGYNVIRLPFSNAMLEPGVMPTGIDYTKNPGLAHLTALEVMDTIIAGAEQRGIYIILDNHRSTPGGGPEGNGLWYTGEYPQSRWIADWEMLARRYRERSNIIAVDLRNEPHDPACWGCGDPALDWRLAAEKAGNAVLKINPDLLILVEGVSTYQGHSIWWGGNLMGARDYPVRLEVPNRLVYSPHEYPQSVAWQPWFNDPDYPHNLPKLWDQFWGYLVDEERTPVLIGEFGTRNQTTSDRQWLEEIQGYIQQKGLSWTFWSLNADSGDTGGLLLDDWTSVDAAKQKALASIQYPAGKIASPGPAPSLEATNSAPPPTVQPTTPVPSPTPAARPMKVMADFEDESLAEWNMFQDPGSRVDLSLVSPGVEGKAALKVDYRLGPGGWGGAVDGFTRSQDWSGYGALEFDFFGGNTGNTIRLELLGQRATGVSGDTSERFVYQFVDDFDGWKKFTVPWSAFTRRTDWQPQGAPTYGLNLAQMWGFNFAPIAGSGSFRLDQIQLSGEPRRGGC